jgi:FixJ family two-component response regulator
LRESHDRLKKMVEVENVGVTDQIMPRMTGLELADALTKVRPGIPVILCTGFSEKVSNGIVGQKGVGELLMKPFTIQEITRVIREALQKADKAG